MTDWRGQDWLGLGGRAALVAGAGGIGEGVALALARAGARVAVTDVSEPRLAEVAKAAAAQSLDIAAVAADLTSAGAARQAVSDAAALLGGLDVFVHAVGVNDRRPVLGTPD
jgi:NAD(P)-dependent dehydrogenase (short-subunit alcohol dehydrogenase family)